LQRIHTHAAEARINRPQKRPRKYQGNSKRTQKRRKDFREKLEKQGFVSVFEYMARMKEKAKAANTEQLQVTEIQTEQESELESAPKELDIEELVPKHVRLVCCVVFLDES